MSNFRQVSPEQLQAITSRIKASAVKCPVMSRKDSGALPSLRGLRGPRSPKGKNGGMTAEEDKARRQERQRVKRKAVLHVSEALVLRACMDVLDHHPAVALWWRQNTGAGQLASGRYVKFSFRGASDLMGVLQGGRFLAVECKATGKHPSPDQGAFLDNVVDAGGCSVCVDDAGKLVAWLDSLNRPANGLQDVREPR